MIERRTLPSGRVSWRVRWYAPDGRQRSKSFATKREASTFDADRRSAGSAWVSPDAGRVTLERVYRQWLDGRVDLKPRTVQGYEQMWRQHVASEFGQWPVARITYEEIARWLTAMSSRYSPSTVRHAHAVLRSVLGYAADRRMVGRNEAVGVRLPRKTRHEPKTLPPADVERLADRLAGDGPDMVRLLAYTGMRWGEAAALQVGDVDVSTRRIHVRRASVEVKGRTIVGTPKRHRSRVIPIVPQLVPMLVRRTDKRPDDAVLIGSRSGTPLRNVNWRRSSGWNDARDALGLSDVRIHDLRHSAASLLLEGGATPVDVAAVLGHATPHTTMTTYAWLMNGRLDEVAELWAKNLEIPPHGQNEATDGDEETE